MERQTDTVEDLPEKAAMDPNSESTKKKKMFTAEQIPEIKRIFDEADADGGGGLDIMEFCVGLKEVFRTDNDEELTALFYKIDTNCDGTVDLGELVEFLVSEQEVSRGLDHKNIFPKHVKVTTSNHYKDIVEVIFRPYEEEKKPECESAVPTGQTRTYQKGQYISISSDGIFTFWSDTFDTPSQIPLNRKIKALPFSHKKKMYVHGMVYIKELKQVAISTSEREVLFYSCNEFPQLFTIVHTLIVEDNTVNAINYSSNGTEAVLSFGDVKGYLYVLISYSIKENGLFSKEVFEKISLRDYPTLYVSTLLKKTSTDFRCVKIPIFNDICNQIQYFPSIDSLAICSKSSKTMVIVTLPTTHGAKFQKIVFESPANKEFFTCVEYSPSTGCLVTGGTDGLVREWYLHNTLSCKQSFAGHVKPITHIILNPKDQVLVTLSNDKNVCVWSEKEMQPLQSFQVQDMKHVPITSMCYNTYNNELVLANTEIGTYLGRGTDVFQNALRSHDKPLCCALYHSIYKQVVSICQDGVVTVWDVLTGKAEVRFKVTPDKHVGYTAIAFDGPQRRLFTVSQDGKLKLWNFSNGSLLGIHPVTMPKEVTGIVCLNERVFVSGRNSKIIYDLDMEGYDNRFLEHDYLNDISSMDVHENTVITASSNGNIVIWNADDAEVRSWINISKSPRVFMAGKGEQGRTGSVPDEKIQKQSQTTNKTAVKAQPLIKCLKKREVKVDTATLLTSADGYICAWSVNLKGGLLGKFRAVDKEGAVITTMSTNVEEEILLTGDSTGKICQWDIRRFGFRKEANEGPFEVTNGWLVSLAQPPLLGSRQCHLKEVVSVQCDRSCKKLITAGLDCQLRLWTNTGSHTGLFGKDIWDATQLDLEKNADQQEAATSATILTINPQKPVFDLPKSSQAQAPIPDNDDFYNYVDESIFENFWDRKSNSSRALPIPDNEELYNYIDEICYTSAGTKKELEARLRKHLKYVPGYDLIKDVNELRLLYPEEFKIPEPLASLLARYKPGAEICFPQCSKQQASTEVHQGSERTSRPGSPNATPTSVCTNATNSSLDMQQSADTVKQRAEHDSKCVHSSPISEKVQLTNSQIQLKPQPPQTPLIRGGADLKQSSPQTINQTRPKYVRVLKNRQGDTLKDNVLTPCPPSTLKALTTFPCIQLPARKVMQPPVYTSKHVHIPSICESVQLTHQQTQLKPQPHSVLTPCPPSTLKAMKTSPRVQLPASTVKQRSVQTSEHVRLPPIRNRVQLTLQQTQLKPQPTQIPLIRGGADLKQSSPRTIDQIRSKYGRVLKNQQADKFKTSVLTPCPPSTLKAMKTSPRVQLPASTVKQRSVQTSEHVRLPPIRNRVRLTLQQTQLKPQPPQTPLIGGGADLKQTSPQTLNQTRSKYGRVLKNQQADKFKDSVLTPCPPSTLKAMKTSPRVQLPASTVKQQSVQTSDHVRFPPIPERVQLTTGYEGLTKIQQTSRDEVPTPSATSNTDSNTGSVHL